MKRDARLHALSSDHHHALVLARRVERAAGAGGAEAAADLRAHFDRDLAPHFDVEERALLPALRRAGLGDLCDRTLRDHASLREHLAAAERGEHARLLAFAALLTEHVRFEERELFPACEEHLPGAVLDEAARLAEQGRPAGAG
jgi:hemerythrin-like domain-containing protein